MKTKEIKINKIKITVDPEIIHCEDCKKSDIDLIFGYCPYTEDIYNEKELSLLCEKCYQNRCYEI